MITVYLAGGMASGWQSTVTQRLHNVARTLSPCDHGLFSPQQYTLWDTLAIRNSDVVLAFMEASNPAGQGTAFEVGYARALDIPVVWVDETNNKYLAMCMCSASVVCRNLDEAIVVIERLALLGAEGETDDK